MFDVKVVWTEHLHWAFFRRIFGKNAFQIRRDVFANPFRFEHRAGLHDVHCAIGFHEQIRHCLAQGLADNEPHAAGFAQREITRQRELSPPRSEDGAMRHERIGREMPFGGFGIAFGLRCGATEKQEQGEGCQN